MRANVKILKFYFMKEKREEATEKWNCFFFFFVRPKQVCKHIHVCDLKHIIFETNSDS